MKQYLIQPIIFFTIAIIFYSCSSEPIIKDVFPVKAKMTVFDKANEFEIDFKANNLAFKIPAGSKVDTILIDTAAKTVIIDFNRNFSYIPFRDSNVALIYKTVKNIFGPSFNDYKYSIRTLHYPIETLVPNYFRKDTADYDYSRLPKGVKQRPLPVVRDVSKSFIPTNGLYDRNIVVWPSHGWYYNNKKDRWEWQRPRLFQTVEDKLPLSFVVPYLIPMLENAGAVVFDPRERDIQKYAVVVDNDSKQDLKSKFYVESSKSRKNKWQTGHGEGFAVGNPPYPNDYNPFTKGTYRTIKSDTSVSAIVSWIPNIPSTGYYSVYISYNASDTNVSDANYIVYHDGSKTEFKINQQIGGSTWIYLGEFKFQEGYHPKTDKVELVNQSEEAGKIISADAVRFGGGLGVIARGGRASGREKLYEGARYYLQYAGMPDTLVYDLNKGENDYNDDYQSRPEYVNYLYGKPFGPNRDRDVKGLGIPIDLSMAFHTDAGITHNDTTVGTFVAYSIRDAHFKTVFPDSMSRLANRDLGDIVQTQIVNDIRKKYDPAWNRRALENAGYSESRNPNVPSLLVELLSHQNFLDQKFAQDPRFKFDVSRAMYKGMLRFLSVQDHFKYVVEPLPVTDFRSEIKGDSVKLSWEPTADSLEPTAKADRYIVYTRIDSGDFDNGQIVDHPYAEIGNIKTGHIYSYKVTAINSGGESFPSEILSVCRMKNEQKKVLIVNGFDRVSAPATVSTPGYSGFVNGEDRGVAYKYDISFTGREYNYDSTSEWKTNDDPGWGASRSDYEGKVIAGNTFDYPYIHGKALLENGYGFESASVKSVEKGEIDLRKYSLVDVILGEQKKTEWERTREDKLRGIMYKTMPEKLQKEIKNYVEGGGNIFISGAYVGSDLFRVKPVDTTDIQFAENILKYRLDADHGSSEGGVYSADSVFMPKFRSFDYNTKLNDKIYAVESPDAIQEVNGGKVILRYSENEFPAGIGYRGKYGVIVMGIPFETILREQTRAEIMKYVLMYFNL
jgi:hypothetical protein